MSPTVRATWLIPSGRARVTRRILRAPPQPLNKPLTGPLGADLDIAEHGPPGEHDDRRPRRGVRARRLPDVAEHGARADLDRDALGHQQLDVAEDRARLDGDSRLADDRLPDVEDDVAEHGLPGAG